MKQVNMKISIIILIAVFAANTVTAQQQPGNTFVINTYNKASLSHNNKHVKTDGRVSERSEKSLLQIPDDINGRLYRLCKIWGYFKYYNQNKCSLKWDTLLYTTINQVLLSANNAEFNNILMAMFNKVGNNSYVAVPAPLPDLNLNFDNSWITDTVLNQTVRDYLDTFTTNIHPDTSTCFIKHNDGTDTSYWSNIDFRNDLVTMQLSSTNEAHRLTAMFYYWNVINYFSPYKNIMDQSWDSTLYQFIPLIRQAATTNDFHKTFLKIVTKINDTHGFTYSGVLTNNFWGGSNLPRIYFTRIDTNCVVAKVENIPGVRAGDVLTSVKGIGIHAIEDSLSDFIPASTPAALYREIYESMMYGPFNSSFSCTFLDSADNPYSVSLTRTMIYSDWYSWKFNSGTTDPYYITDCGYGYVNMRLLQPSDVNNMYNALKNTSAIIFDLRNYPNGTLWDLGPLFFPAPFVSAIFHDPALPCAPYAPYEYYMPGWYNIHDDGLNLGSWTNAEPYSGDVYILVNQETQSQAEYTCQYLSYHPNSKVIGTQTAGADGSVSYITIPGGILSYFTSLGWYYADGYQQQRNGVKIDSVVTPTREGLRHGTDEILRAAFGCPFGINDHEISGKKISVYPNPATEVLNIEIEGDNNRYCLEILNSMGQVIFKGEMTKQTVVQTADYASGVYIIKLKDDASFMLKKFIKE